MAIRLSGLSSGLDTEALIAKLMELERRPVNLITQQNKLLESRKSDISSLKSSLLTLQSKITDLTYASVFKAKIAASSDDKVATASVQSGSINASYTVEVTAMATATRNTGADLDFVSGTKATLVGGNMGAVDANAAIGSAGTFYINSQRIDVVATDTINTVLNKITASAAGVTASFSGNSVTLTQKSVGSTAAITLGSESGCNFLTYAKLTTAAGGIFTAGTEAEENRKLVDTALGAALTNGYFSINGTFIAVDKDTDTLMSVISKINQSGAGVTAFYDAATQKISLTSKTTGNTNITLGTYPVTDTSNFLSQVGLIEGNEVHGSDGIVKVNGIDVTPVNNQVALNGITFNIKSAGTTTITVKSDVDSMVAKVKAFIEQYNSVVDQINGELTEEKVKNAATIADYVKGNLKGDSLLTGIRNRLRSFAYTTVASQPASMQQFSQIGISTGAGVTETKTGHLVLDESKLRSALETTPDLVASFFGKGTASVTDEDLGLGNGSQTTFTLAHTPVAVAPAPTVKVGTQVYTLVAGPPSTTETDHQYSIDYTTGQITFGVAPAASDGNIKVTYDYDDTSGSGAGMALQIKAYLGELTRVGGSFDARIGSNGSLTKSISYNTKRIEDLEARLKKREEALFRQYTNLETTLSRLNSQGNWLTSQLAGLSGK